MSDLAAAVAAVQAALPKIGRTTRGQVGTRNYKYADYETIMGKVRPLLREHGLLWSCQPANLEGLLALRWRLMLVDGSDEWTGLYPVAAGNPQQQGSAITYAKRYAIVAVLDIPVAGEDDDGATASQDAPQVTSRTRARVTGAEHERLREGAATGRVEGTERRTTPDPDDQWATDTPEWQPGSITDAQSRKMHAEFNRLGMRDRDVRLGMTQHHVGRPVESSRELSFAEAQSLIRVLEGKVP